MKFLFYLSNNYEDLFLDDLKMDSNLNVLKIEMNQKEWQCAVVVLEIPRGLWDEEQCYVRIDLATDKKTIFRGMRYGTRRLTKNRTLEITFQGIAPDVDQRIHRLCKNLEVDPLLFGSDAHLHKFEAQNNVLFFDGKCGDVRFSNLLQGSQMRDLSAVAIGNTIEMHYLRHATTGVDFEIHARWQQEGAGIIDLESIIAKHFPKNKINTYTPSSLMVGWPKNAAHLCVDFSKTKNSGYRVLESSIHVIKPPRTGVLNLYPSLSTPCFIKNAKGVTQQKRLKRHWLKGELIVQWNFIQPRHEVLQVHWGVQGGKRKKLALNLQTLPGDAQARSQFFNTAYGQSIINSVTRIAHAHWLYANRRLEICLTVPFDVCASVDLDSSAHIKHESLPVGTFTGKVVRTRFVQNGTRGLGYVWIRSGITLENLCTHDLKIPSVEDVFSRIGSFRALDFVENVEILNDPETQIQKIQDAEDRGATLVLMENPTHIDVKMLDLTALSIPPAIYDINVTGQERTCNFSTI